MKSSYSVAKIIILMVTSLLTFLASAQLRTPENVPIIFYGKIIDQNGKPVSEAKVNFDLGISHMNEYRTESIPMQLKADENGFFKFTGVTAYAIDKISIEKEGYELSKKARRGFVFGLLPDYTPDPTNPVIFKMWKKIGKEQLVGSSWHGKAVCDGRTNWFDLLTGHPNPNGNLEIICMRTPLKSPPPGNGRFDYKFQITVIGGGIQPTQDEFTYLAPQSGYLPSLTFAQKADDPKWDAKIPIPKDYYIKTADGHYGRLFVDWYAAQNAPNHLEWNCSINPSGSRNLER